MSRLIRLTFVLVFFAFAFKALAQVADNKKDDAKKSHFGVVFSFGLPSEAKDSFKTLFDAERIDIRSRDFEIGFVRGRDLGGEWGVSFVQKTLDKGSVVDLTQKGCGYFGSADYCPSIGTKYVLRDAALRGVLIHKFVPFVTVKRRVQFGIAFAGGVARIRGTAEEHSFHAGIYQPGIVPPILEDIRIVPANNVFTHGIKTIPLWKAEATSAVILAPGLKVKFGSGINFTDYPSMSVGISYLIGAK